MNYSNDRAAQSRKSKRQFGKEKKRARATNLLPPVAAALNDQHSVNATPDHLCHKKKKTERVLIFLWLVLNLSLINEDGGEPCTAVVQGSTEKTKKTGSLHET